MVQIAQADKRTGGATYRQRDRAPGRTDLLVAAGASGAVDLAVHRQDQRHVFGNIRLAGLISIPLARTVSISLSSAHGSTTTPITEDRQLALAHDPRGQRKFIGCPVDDQRVSSVMAILETARQRRRDWRASRRSCLFPSSPHCDPITATIGHDSNPLQSLNFFAVL